MNQAMLSFNSGEVSPYLRHRIDFEKTASSAEEMVNLIAMPYGGVIKRPGLRWLAATQTAGTHSKAFPFVASDGTKYIIHFSGYVAGTTAGSVRIYRAADATVAATLSDAATDGPYPSFLWSDLAGHPLRSLQMLAINDVAFFAHGKLHPFQISRLSDTVWKLEFTPFLNPPLLDQNKEEGLEIRVVRNPAAVAWVTALVYYSGDAVTYSGSAYTCILSHTAGAAGTANTPVGASHATYWEAGNAGTPQWVSARAYVVGDKVHNLDTDWECVHAHTSDGANTSTTSCNEPGVGKYNLSALDQHDFLDWWKPVLFQKGDAVKLQALPVFDNASQWVQYYSPDNVNLIPKPYIRGDRVYLDGSLYSCILAHTTNSATTHPATGTSRATYWVLLRSMFPVFSLSGAYPGISYELAVDRPDMDYDQHLHGHMTTNGDVTHGIAICGPWSFISYGTWYGEYIVQESKDGGTTWEQVSAWKGGGDRNVAGAGSVETTRLMRLKWDAAHEPSVQTTRGVLAPDLPYVTGRVKALTRVSGLELTGETVNPLISGLTYRWSVSAFTQDQGFPRALALHESRLVYAGTAGHPVSMWLSRSDDLLNFEPGTDADHAIFVTLATSVYSAIQWLVSQRRLFIGTALGEWVAGSETNDAVLSPSNFLVHQYAANGSAALQPLLVGPSLLFSGRAGGRLLEMSYASDTEVYDTADLSRLAEHLTHAGLQSMAWQQTREPGLWVVRADGVLLHFAYSRGEKIAAWSRHTTSGGLFRDVVVFPSDAGDDEVFFIIDRGAVSCLERFPQHWRKTIEDETGGMAWQTVDGVAGSGHTITRPAHLLRTGLFLVAQPSSTPAAIPTVTDAPPTEFSLFTASEWQIGFPVVARLTSLPVDTTAQDGTTQARRKRTHKLLLSLYKSRGGYVWNTQEARKQAIANTQTAAILRTGWEETIPDAGHLDDLQLHILHDDPFPFCLRSAVMRWALHEP